MIDIARIATNLEQREDGIWFAPGSAPISYPAEQNRECFQIEEKSFWFGHRNRCLVEAIDRFPPPGAIVDIGGGNGYVSQALEHAGFQTVLVEPGIDGVRNARARGLTRLVCATLADAGFRDQTLPAVGLFDVIEHVEDDLRFLKQIRQALIPGGMLYVTVPAYQALWSEKDRIAGHFRRYSLAQIRARLHEAGLKTCYETYLFSFLPLPILMLRVLPTKLGLRRTEDARKARKEHSLPDRGIASALLKCLLDREVRRVRAGHRMCCGGSCLIVARAD